MSSEIRKEDYFEAYEGIEAEVLNSVKFNENKDVSTTYLGKKVMTRQSQLNAEESFPMFSNGITVAELLNGTECHILIDSGATK